MKTTTQTHTGTLRKMRTEHDSPIQYYFRLNDEEISLNDYLNKKITLKFTGQINCIQCGRSTNKSFQQGYCFPCMRRLQECDMCMLFPERCHVEQGTCPKDDWAHQQCYQQHIVYLANSSALKVGITRHNHVPSRWMDQGAAQALPIFQVENRYQSGLVEVAIKKYVSDKTNWRTMLKQIPEPLDLHKESARLCLEAKAELDALIDKYAGQIQPIEKEEVFSLEYPVLQYPAKITSLSLDKTPEVSGVLLGIKGQYIILDTGVMNIRKFGGYNVEFSSE